MTVKQQPISNIKVRIPDNDNFVFNFDVNFDNRWFTIITGTNGSGKSTILKKIKDTFSNSNRIILYNPKRNSLRKQLTQAINDLEVGNRKKNNLLADLNRGWEDNSSIQYPSFQETIVAEFREKLSHNSDKSSNKILEEVSDEYSNLIQTIFPYYEAIDWKVENLGPVFRIKKYGKYELNVEQLSTGEQEVLSLVFSVNSVKENCEILLIDEPELHLNWLLERNLFDYLKKFSEKNKIQVVAATHSQAIFDDRFKKNILYIYFDASNNIALGSSVPESVRKQIAGEAIKMLVTTNDFKTIYVEDNIHKLVIERLEALLDINFGINPVIANNDSSVVSFYRRYKENPLSPAFKNCFFMVDGDNKPDRYPNDERFIHLGKNKCMETYFLDFKILAKISTKKIKTIKSKFCRLINQIKRNKSTKNSLYVGNISEKQLTTNLISLFDPKSIWQEIYTFLGYKNEEDFVEAYLKCLVNDKKRLKSTFDKKFIKFFEI